MVDPGSYQDDRPAVAAQAPGGPRAVPAFAAGPVCGVAVAVGLVLLAVAGQFGYFGDELYFVATGKYQWAWGYADNPWLLPWLAARVDALFPGSWFALRVIPLLMTSAGVVVAGLIAREFGGGRKAQVITAAAYALSWQILASGHVLATSTVDPFLWVVVGWLVVRWARTRSDWALVWAGVVTAIAMQGKFLIAFFWIGIVVGALAVGPRGLLRRPALWVAGVITVAVTIPTLVWQVDNDWPYLLMQQVIKEQNDRLLGGTLGTIPLAVVMAGLPIGAFLLCHGLYQLLRAPDLRPYRFLGVAVVVVTVVILVAANRYYYVAGMYPLVFAASAVKVEQGAIARWWRWVPTWPVFALSVPIAVYLTLPVRPADGFTGVDLVDFQASGSLGWPDLADQTAEVYRGLPSRADTVVMGDSYWQASALDYYGRERGLPAAYGPERGYWFTGRPADSTRQVVYVGGDEKWLTQFFGRVERVGAVTLPQTTAKTANQGVPIYVLNDPVAPWPELWNRMHRP
ncbi:hypothetical protein BJP25_17955 [Actinokineospora bangkokensis]|uniref:Glycosyltransferase RgtA/B/C/D-like domain-containing protein n=1 Tax=Actinokineospora bangkokensis TaxID=1193682 RepID=A0A1Q9LN39_9PSEU|nr:hypothetical protein BJP25_17955 [Actinokineospora bangkokensis]